MDAQIPEIQEYKNINFWEKKKLSSTMNVDIYAYHTSSPIHDKNFVRIHHSI